jgi:hypothetical protein
LGISTSSSPGLAQATFQHASVVPDALRGQDADEILHNFRLDLPSQIEFQN